MDLVIDLNGQFGEDNRSRALYANTADLGPLGLDTVRAWFDETYGPPGDLTEQRADAERPRS